MEQAEQIEQEPEKKEELPEAPQQIDAFFERVMKRHRVNKEYRRARMMKQTRN